MNNVKAYVEEHNVTASGVTNLVTEFADAIDQMKGKCFDIGCGPGTVTRHIFLPSLPPKTCVTGCDILPEMVEFAKKAHADEKRLSFIELDIETEKLPLNVMNAYDHAVSFYCLNWCLNIRKAFDNIYQILRPGGTSLVIIVASCDMFQEYLRMYYDLKYQPYLMDVLKNTPLFHYSKDPSATLKEILIESGFEVLHCSLRDKRYEFSTTEHAKKFLTGINPFMHRMPENVKELFLNQLLEHGMNSDKKGGQIMNYQALHAHFKKPSV